MTGPEHYRIAQHLIEEAQDPAVPEDRAFLMAEAQVHAVLALTAAYAADAIYRRDDRTAWDAATGHAAGQEITR